MNLQSLMVMVSGIVPSAAKDTVGISPMIVIAARNPERNRRKPPFEIFYASNSSKKEKDRFSPRYRALVLRAGGATSICIITILNRGRLLSCKRSVVGQKIAFKNSMVKPFQNSFSEGETLICENKPAFSSGLLTGILECGKI